MYYLVLEKSELYFTDNKFHLRDGLEIHSKIQISIHVLWNFCLHVYLFQLKEMNWRFARHKNWNWIENSLPYQSSYQYWHESIMLIPNLNSMLLPTRTQLPTEQNSNSSQGIHDLIFCILLLSSAISTHPHHQCILVQPHLPILQQKKVVRPQISLHKYRNPFDKPLPILHYQILI